MQTKIDDTEKSKVFQKGYLGFFKFCFFDPKNFKKITFFKKMITKSKIFKIFKKPEYML